MHTATTSQFGLKKKKKALLTLILMSNYNEF